ncbi:MAG: Signal peptidase I U [bacterium ADurb.Bin243]|nr:MAG: Signal peptidase I U [bacterium ADurb.Bin243]
MDCPRCGNELLPNSRHCIECGSELDDKIIRLAEAEKKRKEKSSFGESSDLLKLSFFSIIYPGLGHAFYLREFKAGFLFAALFTALLIAANYFVGTFYIDMPLLIAAYLVYSFAPVHAFRIYRIKFNFRDDYAFRSSVFFFRYFVVVATALIFLGAYSNYQHYFYYVTQVNSAIYEPVLKKGDRVLAETGRKSDYGIRRGDIILFSVTRGVYAGNFLNVSGEYFEKVIGLPGERIKISGGEIYINGSRIEKKFHPLNKNAVFALNNTEAASGAGEYFVCVNGVLTGRETTLYALVKREDVSGKISRIVWPFDRRKNIE